jgi:hypothetical protein
VRAGPHLPLAAAAAAAAIVACLAVVAVAGHATLRGAPAQPVTEATRAPVPRPVSTAVRVRVFRYRGHDRVVRDAYLILPGWYRRRVSPPLPLVISPHGRAVGARADVRMWADLPALGGFAVVAPAGEGPYTWGAPSEIGDLASMPGYLHRALPWVHVDRRRIYAIGGSMGGQETLLLDARYPHLLAGAAAFDAPADFALQYRELGRLRCDARCRHEWREPIGRALQAIARREIGGTPASDPRGYALRSPLTYVRALARSHTPLELWWSTDDLIVRDQLQQLGRLFLRIRHLNRDAPVEEFVGSWIHTAEMRATSRLPLALAELGLLPRRFDRQPPALIHRPARVTGRPPFA